ncbi:MAG: hypothetical protein HY925_08795 [Elusimicrobia bacterium]|nr:hypothetical protein [Elusimicrobiota bacterium]
MLHDSTQARLGWLGAMAQLGGALKAGEEEAASRLTAAYASAPTRCPRCASGRLYKLGDGGRRCPGCKYSFREAAGRWIGRHRLPVRTWLAVLRGFDVGLGVQELAEMASLSMPTMGRVHRTIQLSLAALDPEWLPVVLACEAGAPVPAAFFVRRENGAVKVSVNLSAPAGEPARLDLPPPSADDAALRRFRLSVRRWRGLVSERRALTLKELELRVNLHGPMFDLLVDALTRYVPAELAAA